MSLEKLYIKNQWTRNENQEFKKPCVNCSVVTIWSGSCFACVELLGMRESIKFKRNNWKYKLV